MSIEAMKQAIEALKGYRLETNEAAIKALHQAIEQADHIPDTTKMMPTGKDSLQVEVMKQALDALALVASDESDEGQVAIAAHEELRQAIEQAEKQEPVGFNGLTESETAQTMSVRGLSKREWVGLTDEEIGLEWHYLHDDEGNSPDEWVFARAIEDKLKEKNSG